MTAFSKTISRYIAGIMVVLFSINMLYMPVGYAQVTFLPAAGTMVPLTNKYNPIVIKGMQLYPDNPFKFNFIVDSGDTNLSQNALKEESRKLISYFLAALTTPEKDLWVNLSPYEKDRIIPKVFGDTQMGQELLSQDYLLKQIMATALYPQRQLGREFWQKVYSESKAKFGTTNVPVNTFNKVWILPDKAEVYENSKSNSVFVIKSSLKVMLEQDYLALGHGVKKIATSPTAPRNDTSSIGSQVIREIVIPALQKEVNEGRNFAPLRQVYQSLILAAWYKKNLKDNVIAQAYVDRNKIKGVDAADKNMTRRIYDQYLQAYRKGVYNYIKEDVDPATQTIVPHKYFSGGVILGKLGVRSLSANQAMLAQYMKGFRNIFRIKAVVSLSAPMLAVAASVMAAQPALSADVVLPEIVITTHEDEKIYTTVFNPTQIGTMNWYQAIRYTITGNKDRGPKPEDIDTLLSNGMIRLNGSVIYFMGQFPSSYDLQSGIGNKEARLEVAIPRGFNLNFDQFQLPEGLAKVPIQFNPAAYPEARRVSVLLGSMDPKSKYDVIRSTIRQRAGVELSNTDIDHLFGTFVTDSDNNIIEGVGNIQFPLNAEGTRSSVKLNIYLTPEFLAHLTPYMPEPLNAPKAHLNEAVFAGGTTLYHVIISNTETLPNAIRRTTGLYLSDEQIEDVLFKQGFVENFKSHEVYLSMGNVPTSSPEESPALVELNVWLPNQNFAQPKYDGLTPPAYLPPGAPRDDDDLFIIRFFKSIPKFLSGIFNSDYAMNVQIKAITPENGGIDLGKVDIDTHGGAIRTAFSDPQQLKMLLNAQGLVPVIYNIQLLTLPVMSTLLGIDNNHG